MMYAQATDGVAMMPSVRAKAESDALKKCQKCLKTGHWTYECKGSRVYVVRNSKSAQVCVCVCVLGGPGVCLCAMSWVCVLCANMFCVYCACVFGVRCTR